MRTLKDQIIDIEKAGFQNAMHLQALEEYCSHNLYAGLLLAMAQLEAFVDYFKTLEPDKHGKMTEFVAKRSREIAELQFERMQKAEATKAGEKLMDEHSAAFEKLSEPPAAAGAFGNGLDLDEGRDLVSRIVEQDTAIDASRAAQLSSMFSGTKVREG